MRGLGRILLGVSCALLGGLSIGVQGFAHLWPLLPKWMPWHDALAMLSAAILLASGIALLVPRAARISALVLAGLLLLRLLLLKLPAVAAHPLIVGEWEDFSENLALVAGGWTIFAMWPRQGGARPGDVRIGQILFALALPAFGLSHFFYMNLTAPLIPSWLPYHVGLGYFTGAAHIAAGVGILAGIVFSVSLARLAATLEAVMVSLFTLIVWVPMIAAAPTTLSNWSEICLSAAISGAAWAVAESFRER
jgi:uncharacterized membrane protein